MYRKLSFFISILILLSWGCQEDPPSQHGIDISHQDPSVSPSEDFFKHANGKWLAEAEIPASKDSWGSFVELIENNGIRLRTILDEISATEHPKGSNAQLIGDFYYSGMDSVSREEAGFTPIQGKLDVIASLSDNAQLSEVLPQLHLFGMAGFFRSTVRPDLKNSTVNIFSLYQGGLGLPSRDYYFNESPRFVAYRKAYQDYIGTGFQLTGSSEEEAQNAADLILNLETRIASVSRTRLALRDNEKNYNKYSVEDAEKLVSAFSLKAYMDNLGVSEQENIIVGQPEFFEGISKILSEIPIEDVQTYLKWRVITGNASRLSHEFEAAAFNFGGKTLRGVPEMQPRWKRISQSTDGLLGEALGELYVDKYFGEEAKTRVNELVNNLRIVLEQRIEALDWMGDETKEQALYKLHKITQKLGYPDKWKDYSKVDISRETYATNVMNAIHFSVRTRLDKAGKEVDRSEWGMSPPTVNAYYNPSNNEIVFPAGILQPPFFYPDAIDPVNYGGIGAVIGHEITHGFDDRGSEFDADGNLKSWWTEEDRERFEGLTKKIVDQYSAYVVLDSIHVNGELTLGENIADLGGVTIAYEAMKLAIEKNGPPPTFDGLTPEQQFFYSYANLWRGKYRDDALLQRIKTDSHSPGVFRTNGVLSNFKPFYDAFGVKEGDGMYREELVKIW